MDGELSRAGGGSYWGRTHRQGNMRLQRRYVLVTLALASACGESPAVPSNSETGGVHSGAGAQSSAFGGGPNGGAGTSAGSPSNAGNASGGVSFAKGGGTSV